MLFFSSTLKPKISVPCKVLGVIYMFNGLFHSVLRKAKEDEEERESTGGTDELPYLRKLIEATFIVIYNFNPILRLGISPLQRIAKWG